jgi:tripartite-type tricarboxylate transporter receptor subunit TctC
MSKWYFRFSYIVILTAILCLSASGGNSQTATSYPSRPIELIVAFAPGTGADLSARVLVDYLAGVWKQPIKVLNVAGGAQIPGVQQLLNAKADGYTMFLEYPSTSSMQVVQEKMLPYKIEDRTYVAMFCVQDIIVFCNPSSPWETLKDMVKFAKEKPEEFSYAGIGGTNIADVSTWHFLELAGIDRTKAKRIGFTGGPQMVTAVAGGHVQFSGSPLSAAKPFIDSGKLRVLATMAPKRLPDLPEVPTLKELGYDCVWRIWSGISGHSNLPIEVINKWEESIKKALDDPKMRDAIKKIKADPDFLPRTEFRKMVLNEAQIVRKLFPSQ